MSDNSRLTKNTVLLYIRMLIVMAISFYTSRILLQNLGVTDFGLYNVVGGVAMMFMFLNSAMNSSTQRYLTIAIGKGNQEEIKKIFNVSTVIHFFIGLLIVVLCEIFGLWFISNKMVMPEGREVAVFWTFQLSLLAAFITIITVPFNALIIAREKMSAFAYISIIDILFKLFVAYIISVVHFDRLIIYALLIAISQIIICLIYSWYCKKHFPESKFQLYRYEPLYKEITIFASWGLLGHISWIINTSIQDMMLNVFFSPVINAARAVAMKVATTIGNFNESFQVSVTPQITKSYASGNKDRMFSLIINGSRFSLYLVWLFSLPVILCIDNILDVWLVEVPQYTALFVILIVFDNLIVSIKNPLIMAIRARGRIKLPEITSGLTLIMNLPVSYALLKEGFEPYWVFIVLIFFDIIAQLFRLYFSKIYLDLSVRAYLTRVVVKPFLVMTISGVIPFIISQKLFIENRLLSILIISAVSIVSICGFVWFVGINREEKKYILNFVKSKIKL